jgi:O-methyltransferase
VYSGNVQKSRLLLTKHPLISDQIEPGELALILAELEGILLRDIPGDIVELGCYIGTTSLFLRRLLDLYGSDKQLHVYDSFAGLPNKSKQDQSRLGEAFVRGELYARRADVEKHFRQAGLRLPTIHKGWFEQLGLSDMPPIISYAFIDGDFHSSILASLQLAWPCLSPGGVVLIDDYDSDKLPGVKRAVDDFFGVAGPPSLRIERSMAIIRRSQP